ncbi:carbohydrate-binding protein [Streptomyces sp. NPDC004647]|uniref:carbohydrate-binding protein n=1 Tax=Streptomyces sp. NPDC004647 TaxID=3154671 RepID=UPI0033A95A8A
MTAGNNGASTPENDDPFGYLYRSEGGEDGASGNGAAPRTGGYGYPGPAAQPGVPRTSYNQVSRVGERRYGQQQTQQQSYGQQQTQQQPYGQQANAAYAAPETLPGGAPRQPGPPPHGGRGHGGGRGPNSRGLLIGAIAVVAAVVIGIGVAMATKSDDGKKDEAQNSAPPADDSGGNQGGGQKEKPSGKDKGKGESFSSKKEDAASLRLGGPAAVASDIPNARSKSGSYVTMNSPGATASWSVDVPKDGQYTLFMGYSVPGKDANTTLVVNDKPRSEPHDLENFAHATEGAWDKGWTHSFAYVQLNKGTNTLQLSCQPGNQCDYILDQVWMKEGQVKG